MKREMSLLLVAVFALTVPCRAVAQTEPVIKSVTPANAADLVARVGGEPLIVILSGSHLELIESALVLLEGRLYDPIEVELQALNGRERDLASRKVIITVPAGVRPDRSYSLQALADRGRLEIEVTRFEVALSGELVDLQIIGPAAMEENTAAQFTLSATFSDRTRETVAADKWSVVGPANASISPDGLLSLGDLSSATQVTIEALWGMTKGDATTARMDITVQIDFEPVDITTAALTMTGLRFRPVTVTTAALTMTGLRFHPVTVTTVALTMTGLGGNE